MSKVRYRRLIIECSIVTIIVSAIMLVNFLPWFFSQPVDESKKYDNAKALLFIAKSYNYNKGRSSTLEARFEDGLDQANNSDEELFFNLLAKAYYYDRLGFYNIALVNVDRALSYAPDDRQFIDTAKEAVRIAHQSKDFENETHYQQILDSF